MTADPQASRLDGEVHVRGAPLTPTVRQRLAAVVERAADGARLAAVRPLTGGLWAHSHALDAGTRDGRTRRLALRRYVRWSPGGPPDEGCRRHAVALSALAGSGLPVADLLWSDPDGDVLDVPALLTTLLPGAASLTLSATPRGLDRLAAALAAVHAVPAPAALARTSGFGESVGRALQDAVPRWLATCPDRDGVLAALRSGAAAADAPVRLTHGDFHAGNVLWTGTVDSLALTGVVDWDVAGPAPVGADVGYCRADLAMAFGQPVADAFGAAYARHAGPVPDAAWWDLLGAAMCWQEFREWLPAYHVFGVADLTGEEMEHRLAAFTRDAVERARPGEDRQR